MQSSKPESKLTLHAHFSNKRAALASCRSSDGALSLFVPTSDPIPAGTEVGLLVTFGDTPERFDLLGTVTWRRAQARGLGLEPGVGIEFSGGEKYRAAKMLAFCAGRPLDAGTAFERRVTAQVPVWVRVGQSSITGQVRDLSSSGVFVAGSAFSRLARGTDLVLQLNKGWLGFGVKELKARVVWSGYKNGLFGFGARFLDDAAHTRPMLQRYLGPVSPRR